MIFNVRSRALLTAALVPALTLAIGCKKPTPVGKWSGNLGAGQSTLELKADGTLTQNSSVALLGGDIVATGTYTLKDDKISLTVSDVQAGGKSVMAMIPAQYRGQLNQEATWKVDGDTLTLTAGGKDQVLTRVK